jgi:hypothetical protein
LRALIRSGLVAALLTGVATAQEFQAPHVVLSAVDWAAAGKSVKDGGATPDELFKTLNQAVETRFPGIGKSSVPVLLPMDVAAYRKDLGAGAADAKTSTKYFGDFTPSKFFLPGPAGYDVTFWIDPKEAGFKFRWPKPIEVELTGASYIYDLPDPNHKEVFPPPKELADKFPGMQRVLSENHVRYAFERFGVPYVVDIQCYDRPPSRKYLSCREADPVAVQFLGQLQTAGGTPQPIAEPKADLSRPATPSGDFTYYPPGDLIPDSGWKKMPGRQDYTVYARFRFPIANAPAYVKSQSFNPWGDCYRSGHTGRIGRKDASYACKVNGRPLVFNEGAAVNWTYPWRDNFCELRDFLVGQCPGGYGHQGEDIRPAYCVMADAEADRCLPYRHYVAAVHDGLIWRTPGNLAAYIVWNTANEHVRVRYLHMNPKMMDADGVVSGRVVKEGDIIGKVADWGDFENGTSYHLHFNIQVFTRIGWVWVNPYMTLVASYERLIGARGREIKPGDPPPQVPNKPPIILHPEPVSESSASAEKPVPPPKPVHRHKRHPRHHHRHKRHSD